jgi:[ribosomal protein S5]-alanine N-acetyltransferase
VDIIGINMLETKRLSLREISLEDLENIHGLHSLPETDEYNTLGIPDSLQTTEKLFTEWLMLQKQTQRNSYIFCMDKKDDKEFVGLIALNLGKVNYKTAEVWFKTHKGHWRQGYTSEAIVRLLEYWKRIF